MAAIIQTEDGRLFVSCPRCDSVPVTAAESTRLVHAHDETEPHIRNAAEWRLRLEAQMQAWIEADQAEYDGYEEEHAEMVHAKSPLP